MDTGLQLIRRQRGMLKRVAETVGLSQGRVSQWDRVPAELLPQVEAITGVPRHILRPDICPPPAADDAPEAA
jgi:DNA-binding transcriptional regulator YdaS (Cro superfamily)